MATYQHSPVCDFYRDPLEPADCSCGVAELEAENKRLKKALELMARHPAMACTCDPCAEKRLREVMDKVNWSEPK